MKIDLHIHSTHSYDGTATPREVARRCKKVGLAGFAITDHNSLKGSAEALSIGREEGLVVVRGLEVSTSEGHVLAYGVRDEIRSARGIDETIEEIHAAGGIAVAAHPKRFPSGMGLKRALEAGFDGIEALNGGSSRRGNLSALRATERLGMPITGGSDAHRLTEVGKAWTVVEGASSEDDIVHAVLKRSTSVGGRSRDVDETIMHCLDTTRGWVKRGFRRL